MIKLTLNHHLTTKHNIALIPVILLTLLFGFRHFAYALDLEEANAMIPMGENALTSAFESVLNADRTGANVTRLIHQLNEAADLLERAEVSLKKGVLTDVLNLTGHSIRLAEEVNEEAVRLRQSTLTQRESAFSIPFLLAIVGFPSFSFFMFVLWRWFKGYYLYRVLQSRPEVSEVVEP